MRYVQTNNGTFVRHILNEFESIQWDETNKTSVRKLPESKREEFGLFRLQLVTPPSFDPVTQARTDGDAVLIGDVWTQQWIVEGLTAEQTAINIVESKIAKELAVSTAVQSVIDKAAQALGFDNIDSITKYIGFANTFEADATSLRNWVPLIWDYVYKVRADIESGARAEPTVEELLLELPGRHDN
jgi:hypothetical protein